MSDTTSTGASRQPASDGEAEERTRAQVEDAFELARYVIEHGIKDSAGQPLAFDDIKTIEATAALFGVIAVEGGRKPVTNEQWAAFEQAYYRLAIATSPVTAQTLRNTRFVVSLNGPGCLTLSGLIAWVCGRSPAQRFTRRLWVIAFLAAIFVLITEWQIDTLSMVAAADQVKVQKDLWVAVQPWAYGVLGACAYLLRSGHYFIYQRSFDLRRTPEYYNRVLLGGISGGAIILFANYLSPPDDTTAHIGATALGFIAGYSTDFLFNTVERVITALFPKVAVQTVPRDQPPKSPTSASGAGSGSGSAGSGTSGGGAGGQSQGAQGAQGAQGGGAGTGP